MLLVLIFRRRACSAGTCHERTFDYAHVALAVAFAALVTLPFWMPGIYYINVSSQVLFYAIFALGLNILSDTAASFRSSRRAVRITAYATAYLLSMGFGHTAAIVGALVISLGCTAIFAALALRATGIGFIMITLALGQIIWGLATAGSASPAATTAST